ncbi:MAG: class I SAM-dependent methyltransferase [Phenylobacterium sp.]|nr:class I SAM-dependent methyltransferase [Phenylobacterium sp.]
MKTLASFAAVAVLAATAASAQTPANITAALADPARPAADTARDAARKPGELLAFTGVKSGDKVVDLIMGGGYFTRILSPAVGPAGQVYAYQPAEFVAFSADYGKALKDVAAADPNVTPIGSAFAAFDLPDGLDLVFTVQNYHDLHLKPFPADTAAKVNAEVFKSLNSGGVYLIVDHEAKAGTGIADADTLHRIDIAAVKQEVEAAGFKLEAESQLLDMPSDPRTANVFDPAIRGKTDQFILKFRKP